MQIQCTAAVIISFVPTNPYVRNVMCSDLHELGNVKLQHQLLHKLFIYVYQFFKQFKELRG